MSTNRNGKTIPLSQVILCPDTDLASGPSFYPSADGSDTLPDITEAEILALRRQKAAAQRRHDYWTRIITPFVYPVFTAEDLFEAIVEKATRLAGERGKVFKVDEVNERIISQLAHYFTGQAEKVGLDPHKGILLRGPVGTGKTLLLECLNRNPLASFDVVPTSYIVDAYGAAGKDNEAQDVLAKFSINRCVAVSPHEDNGHFGQSIKGLCLDDLGMEPEGNRFGKPRNVIQDVLTARYRNGLFTTTHATTNARKTDRYDDLSKVYDGRTIDRFNEMFNSLEFDWNAKSRRA